MNTSHPVRHLAAATAAAAVLATGAGATTLALATPAAAASPAATALRTLRDDTLLALTGGLITPAAHPAPRTRIYLAGTYRNQ